MQAMFGIGGLFQRELFINSPHGNPRMLRAGIEMRGETKLDRQVVAVIAPVAQPKKNDESEFGFAVELIRPIEKRPTSD